MRVPGGRNRARAVAPEVTGVVNQLAVPDGRPRRPAPDAAGDRGPGCRVLRTMLTGGRRTAAPHAPGVGRVTPRPHRRPRRDTDTDTDTTWTRHRAAPDPGRRGVAVGRSRLSRAA